MLSPEEWQEMLLEARSPPADTREGDTDGPAVLCGGERASSSAPNPTVASQEATGLGLRNAVILDVRNGYEWDAGHFIGASRPLEVRPAGLLNPSASFGAKQDAISSIDQTPSRLASTLPQQVTKHTCAVASVARPHNLQNCITVVQGWSALCWPAQPIYCWCPKHPLVPGPRH